MKKRILVIDDDDSVRASLVKVLEKESYDVVSRRTGIDGMRVFRTRPVDLVVLDVSMTGKNGWNVFESMKELNPFVPVIIITAEFDQRQNAVSAGAEALIEKPLDVGRFLEIVHELLSDTRERRLERVCGDDAYCRFVAGYYAPYLSRLDERLSEPLVFSESLNAALGTKLIQGNSQKLLMELEECA